MKFSTIVAVFGLAGAGAAQSTTSTQPGPPPPASSLSPRPSPATQAPSSSSVTVPPPATTAAPSSSIGPVTNSTTVTTVVNIFVSICIEPKTFWVGPECYTATSAYEAVTVTNCPCTVESVCTAPYAKPTGTAPLIITGSLVTSTADAAGVTTAAPAVSTADAVGGKATQYVAATSTTYVTSGGNKAASMMTPLMGLIMPLFGALML